MSDPRRPASAPSPPATRGEERYRPLTRRRRLLIVLLAVATAVSVMLALLDPPGGVSRKRPAAETGSRVEAVMPNPPGVGGKVDVLPPVRPASR